MAEKEILLPDIGDFTDVEVIEVLVSDGDQVEAEQSLLTLESDKASMEIPTPYAGVIKQVKISLGDIINKGDVLALIDVSSDAPAAEKPADATPAPEPEVKPQAEAQAAAPRAQRPAGEKRMKAPPAAPVKDSGLKAHASPAVRRFARELGVDLSRISGSGAKNRIVKDDVQNFVKQSLSGGGAPAAAGSLALPAIPVIDFSQFGEIEEKPLSRIKKISGRHLHGSWLNVPHVSQFDEADITELEAFRKQQKDIAARQDIKLTFMPFLMKACAHALMDMPEVNSSLSADGENLIVKKYINLGVAVNTSKGLVVPVVRDVEKKGIMQLAAELMEVSGKAREGKLSPTDMQGGSFTISSLGGIGGTQFAPIVNAPEVAILGVSRAAMKPVWDGKEFQPRLIMPFSLSYDHRVIDGVHGVSFTTRLAALLTDIRQLVL
ncbi:MAG: dihydrolipoyllysine-residue acetyltransferase [gamma proteobacterium symbiont of Bathyaustriella thionipta]|nr:dihydrolipoyllysine-residue acetyltransferase [gamma proteobacterium symbiont of Bathyaustriella thionipta]